jgi:transketolase
MNPILHKAENIRLALFESMQSAGGGHYGGCLSCVEILTVLYDRIMQYDPKNPGWIDRDRLVLSKGHAGPALYATLCKFGFFEEERLAELDHNGGRLSKHADRKVPGVDFSTGALGMGLSIANGMAVAARLDGKKYRVFAILGDGELQEGQIWEAVMTAAQFKLDNLVAIVDRNMCQIDGTTEEIMALESLPQKWTDFGWHVLETDGHDVDALEKTILEACEYKGAPVVIIAHTTKGKGISFMEDTIQHRVDWHAGTVPQSLYEMEIKRMRGDHKND